MNPLTARLVVADASRTDKTICLAVSPALKAYGIPGRARLFEVNQILEKLPEKVEYTIAPPRMALYLDYSERINNIYKRYVAPEDIHIYSVDECFIDLKPYLKLYKCTARDLAIRMIHDVLRETGITATAGIGTNLYLCKVAMDISAKHQAADEHGVRIAELDEPTYRKTMWEHLPMTSFWGFGSGTVKRLNNYGIRTMGDLARFSLKARPLLYKLLGEQAEIIIDHAWGYEPCTIQDIKTYRPSAHSLTNGQVLSEPYDYHKAKIVLQEMVDSMALRLLEKRLVCNSVTVHISYDAESLTRPEIAKYYNGPIKTNYYGKAVPKSAHGSILLPQPTHSVRTLSEAVMQIYEEQVNPILLIRRLNISVDKVLSEDEAPVASPQQPLQMNLFEDPQEQQQRFMQEQQALQEEEQMQQALLDIKHRYGKNAILKGLNFQEGATAKERNQQIGGHKA